jgi:parallel beta-helix repeat protein
MLFFAAGVFPIVQSGEVENYLSKSDKYLTSFSGRGILYVGGSGLGNYTTIQEALNNASGGDTIFVYNGTYTENLNIIKKITLLGEDRDTTIIDGVAGVDSVVTIVNTDVKISGFTIQGDPSGQDGVTVVTLMEDVIISTNNIKDCGNGIKLQITTERIVISDNIIFNNDFAGIALAESDRNDIFGNTVENNGDWGISLSALSKQNNISNNDVIDNHGGIQLSQGSEQNEIIGNNVRNNDLEGIILEGLSTDTLIKKNNISNNLVGIKLTGSGKNIIENNNIQDNDIEGLRIDISNTNQMKRNNFIGNNKNAIYSRTSQQNIWDSNYWDDWIGVRLKMPIFQIFPKVIRGGIIFVSLDSNPQLEPYNI